MSERERKLLTLFAAAGAFLLVLWGYKSYESKKLQIQADRRSAESALQEGKLYLASRESLLDEIEWLAEHEPEPQAAEQVPTMLQQLADSEAMRAGMSVKKRDILPDRSAESSEERRYKVAQVKFTVTGNERNLFTWFDRMHSPNEFRAISEIIMSPNRENDSMIDCIVTFDQWFVPLNPNL